jgi:hypothetical protein
MRSLLASSNLGYVWLFEAMKAACYMRNRTAHSKLTDSKSPFQKLTHRKPQVHKMHVFGCRVSVLNSAPTLKSKLAPRGRLGYFIGYPCDTAGYRVLMDSGYVTESNDVLFFDSTVLDQDSNFLTDSSSVKKKGLPELVLDKKDDREKLQ